MSFTSWLRRLQSTLDAERTGRNCRRQVRRAAPRGLQFETLEDRTVPSFSPAVDYSTGTNPQAAATADFNGDGRQDLAVANYYSGNVSILLGNANGTFQPVQNSPTGAYPLSLAVGDFNGDGKLDLVSGNGAAVSVLLGNGNGTFQAPANIDIGSSPTSVAVGDFNVDGKLDLGVTSNHFVVDSYGYYGPYGHYEGQANVLLGNGDGSFHAAVATSLGYGYPSGAAVADFDGDGRDDFATTDGYSTVSVLLSNSDGSGNLLAPTGFATGSYPQSVMVGDFNGDGISDLVTRNSYSLSVLLGNGVPGLGDGTFNSAQTTAVSSSPSSVAVGDFNADGKLDLCVTSNHFVVDSYGYYGPYGHYEGQVEVLLGQGNTFFAAPLPTALGVGWYNGVASGDFNADRFPDLAGTNSE